MNYKGWKNINKHPKHKQCKMDNDLFLSAMTESFLNDSSYVSGALITSPQGGLLER